MATGQSILDRMEVLDPEQQLQPGESDVTKGLVALNMAQDQWEAIVATRPDVLGGTSGTVSIAQGVETTAFPAGLLRVDDIWMLDGSLPSYRLEPLHSVGGHRASQGWFWNLVSSASGSGKPDAYWTNGTNIFWSPLPDANYTARWYGFQAAADITAAGTFAYPDIVMLPLANMAIKIISVGLDDSADQLSSLSQEIFQPVIDTLANFNRTEASGWQYRYSHDT